MSAGCRSISIWSSNRIGERRACFNSWRRWGTDVRWAARAAATSVSMVAAVGAAELAVRAADGWPLVGRLGLAEHAVDEATTRADERPDRRHMRAVALASGVEPEWYDTD